MLLVHVKVNDPKNGFYQVLADLIQGQKWLPR